MAAKKSMKVVTGKKALPKGKGAKALDFSAGPRTESRKGQGTVTDKSGMKSGADLGADVLKLRSPGADIPAAAEEIASKPVPVLRDPAKAGMVGWDYHRDQKLKEVPAKGDS